MPYQISWEDRGVSFQYTGLTSDGEVAAAVRHVEADERFDRVRYTIHDISEMWWSNIYDTKG